MRRGLIVGLLALAVFVAWYWMSSSDDTPTLEAVDEGPRRTVVSSGTRKALSPGPVSPAAPLPIEEDSPERVAYRADLGDIADEVGLAVVECAFRDPRTGGEVGRYVSFVDGVGRPDNGDDRRKAVRTIQDDLERTWKVSWDMPEGATHTTCTAELAKMFTLVVDAGTTGATRASCNGSLSIGRNERPVLDTPCHLVATGAEPVDVPQMAAGETYVVTLVETRPEKPESLEAADPVLDPEAEVERVLDQEDDVYARSDKWAGLVDGLRALRDRTPEGRIWDLLDNDIRDYQTSVDAWQIEEEKASDKSDAVIEALDAERQ